MKCQLGNAILNFDVTDILGCDPTRQQIPVTDPRHCAHCTSGDVYYPFDYKIVGPNLGKGGIHLLGGKENSRGRTNCLECNAFLRSRTDYGSLTDAIVWTYLFEETEIPLICNNADVHFTDAVATLPAIRK